MREAKVEEFMNLRQGSMTVKKYCLKFTQLSKYAFKLVADPRSNMSKFVTGVSDLVFKECRTTMLTGDMDITRLMTHAQQIKTENIKEREKRNKKARTGLFEYGQPRSGEGNHLQFQVHSSMPAPSSTSAPTPRKNQEQ